MGCNQSTQSDVQASRQQRDVAQQQASSSRPNSPTKTQATPSRTNRDGSAQQEAAQYSASYSDQRTLEQDYFKEIIAKTSNKFIDVSQTVSATENRNAPDRAKQYSARIGTLKVNAPTTVDGDHKTAQVAMLLGGPTVSAGDMEQIRNGAKAVSQAVTSTHIQHMGDLVVSLPDIA